MNKRYAGVALAMILAGCASSPETVQTISVSPMQYKDYDCAKIGIELKRTARRIDNVHDYLKARADANGARVALGVIFLPALLLMDNGDGPEVEEYARLKGEYEALEKLAIQKKCDPSIIPPQAPQTTTAAVDKPAGE